MTGVAGALGARVGAPPADRAGEHGDGPAAPLPDRAPQARAEGEATPDGREDGEERELELSIVMPCLDEADTLATCIAKARRALLEAEIDGEVLVADNGSTDGSQAIARAAGARVVDVAERGYGAALIGGIRAARGRAILMGDADDSYDFLETPKFVAKLREGYELVQGCRLPAGGGRVLPGAMPPSHRWIGNPALTFLVRFWFEAPIRDVYCGMRAFRKDLFERLEQGCRGMEFATEMIILAARDGARIAEVPITLHPDGRKSHPPHLRTVRDGWRTLRLFLTYCPRWLYRYPAGALALSAALGYAAIGTRIVREERTTAFVLVAASLAGLLGLQLALIAELAEAWSERDPGSAPRRIGSLEKNLALALGAVVIGAALAVRPLFGAFPGTLVGALAWIVPGASLVALGVELSVFAFFVHLLGQRRG